MGLLVTMDREQLVEKIVSNVVARVESARADSAQSPGPADLARYIDHTLLRPEASASALDTLCQEAVQLGFFSVCVNSSRVACVARKLQGTSVKVCSVVGFPLGSVTGRVKALEAREAVSDGAAEIHMVLNIGLLRSREYRLVEQDIRAVRRATRPSTVLNVIIETVLLSEEEKVLACELSRKAGADFVTPSTGFLGGAPTVDDITLMKRVAGKQVRLKASGIRSYATAVAMIGAGASRLGSRSGVSILAEAETVGSGRHFR